MKINLHNLQLMAKLGVFEWERQSIRAFPTQVELKITAGKDIRKDDLQSTIDYAELEEFLLQHAAEGEWQLLERLIESLASASLDKFAMIKEITIAIGKPQALDKTENVTVSYSKQRD